MTQMPIKLVSVMEGMFRYVAFCATFGHTPPVNALTCHAFTPSYAQRNPM